MPITLAGIYVHIPFCRSRCVYCDFFSTTREAEMGKYVQALCREIAARRHELQGQHVRTIYIGGGTPSLLPAEALKAILDSIHKHYMVGEGTEVTMEMNPDDVGGWGEMGNGQWTMDNGEWRMENGEWKMENGQGRMDNGEWTMENGEWRMDNGQWGMENGEWVNRISLGIQTFDDDLLRLLHRRHDSAGAVRAVKVLQKAGIKNISIDLIYGLPGQTMEMWEHDLDVAFALGVQHLSAYALSYEEGTLLSRWRREGRVAEVSEELSVAMYERLCQRATDTGFEHYEISNFALPGYASRHNSSYWRGEPYLGFGPGAHSYDGERTRRANRSDLSTYIGQWGMENGEWRMGNGEWGMDGVSDIEVLTDAELFDEAVMCGLRTREGIKLDGIARRFGQGRVEGLLRMARPHLQAGRLALEAGCLHLTQQSLMTSDDIMSDLMAV